MTQVHSEYASCTFSTIPIILCLFLIQSVTCCYRYEQHAKEAEVKAIRGGLLYSVFIGATFTVSLSTFGVAFW